MRNEIKLKGLWIRCVDIALLLTLSDRNPSGLASEANHKVPMRLTFKSTITIDYRAIGPRCQYRFSRRTRLIW